MAVFFENDYFRCPNCGATELSDRVIGLYKESKNGDIVAEPHYKEIFCTVCNKRVGLLDYKTIIRKG